MSRKRMLRRGVYGAAGVLIVLIVLHPYAWQSMFGPTIRGVPVWSWQQRLRQSVAQRDSAPLLEQSLHWLGVKWDGPELWPNLAEDMVPVLLSMVDDPSPDVRHRIAFELGEHPLSAETADALMRLLEDPVPRVRGLAAQSLANGDPPFEPALPKLREHLTDADGVCRTMSALGVCRMSKGHDERALSVLRDGLQSGDATTRLYATEGLCLLGKRLPELLPGVAAAARADKETSIGLARQAAHFGVAAVPVLEELLKHADLFVRIDAAYSLAKLGPVARDAIPALRLQAAHANPYVSDASRFALFHIDPDRYPYGK